MDLNKATIIGRLTQDPEMRATPQGTNVCSFSVATNFVWKDQGGQKQERVEYHNIVAWRKLAEICGQYLKKGRQIYIEGRLQTRSWQDPQGNKKYRTEIVADNMIMLGGKNDETHTPATPQRTAPQTQTAPDVPTIDVDADAPKAGDDIEVENIPF